MASQHRGCGLGETAQTRALDLQNFPGHNAAAAALPSSSARWPAAARSAAAHGEPGAQGVGCVGGQEAREGVEQARPEAPGLPEDAARTA